MKIQIAMELDFVDNLIDWNCSEEKRWLMDEILPKSTVSIFSKEIGDHITKSKTINNPEIIAIDVS